MASNIFSYVPTTGQGNTVMTVSTQAANTTQNDQTAVITVTNGSKSATITAIQRYCPFLSQFGSRTFPASGGSIYFSVHTEYNVVFRSVPSWITITYGDNVQVYEGQTVSSGDANNRTFTLTATANNTGQERSVSATFNMGHYINNTLQQPVSYLSFSQPAQESSEIEVDPYLLEFDYNDSTIIDGQSFDVITTGNWTSEINDDN